MAQFLNAFLITMQYEGGYANAKADSGGETIFGISRNNNPDWKGWALVDAYKAKNGLNGIVAAMTSDADFQKMVQKLYTVNYWNINRCGDIYDQQLANVIFDTGVNMGTGRAARFLQQAFNDFAPGKTITVDGIIGDKTIAAVNQADPVSIYSNYQTLRKLKYGAIVAKNPSQHQFYSSWMSRLKPYNQITN